MVGKRKEKSMENKCAWCQIDTEKQMKFTAENNSNGCCPICHCCNDVGQKNISINSMRQIYKGALELMESMVAEFDEILNVLGVTQEDIETNFDLVEGEKLEFCRYTKSIVRTLFLSETSNAGGTSAGNLTKILGIKNHIKRFVLLENEDDELLERKEEHSNEAE
jgi:hypothetical protein